jgi:hypothetical protein
MEVLGAQVVDIDEGFGGMQTAPADGGGVLDAEEA